MPNGRFEVELTAGAETDLESIFDYVAEHHSVEQAEALLKSFLVKIEALEQYSLRGSIPKELDALGIREFRQLLMRPYRLIYHVVAQKGVVMIIADGRRDMQSLLEHRLIGQGL
jgi:toxin ParE1/3/4